MPAIRRAIIASAMLAGWAGCTVGPDYHLPPAETPPSFGEPGRAPGGPFGGAADDERLKRWWTLFRDPTLDSLIDRALRHNRDLKVAISRVREARAEREVAAGAFLPEVDATAGYNRSLGSRNVSLPLAALAGGSSSGSSSAGASTSPASVNPKAVHPDDATADSGSAGASPAATGATPGGPNSPFGEGGLPGVTTNLFQAGFDAVWEIDVFGGTRRAVAAADAQAAAAADGADAVRVTLLGEVASAYLQLRALQAREAIARQNVVSQRTTWKIEDDKFKAGLGDEFAVAEQAAQLQLVASSLPPLEAAERTEQHALAFMLGEEPAALAAELSPARSLPSLPPAVPIGVPSDLLRRRPDIRRAERDLAAATAEIGVATAQLFPQFSVTGSLGLDSSNLKQLPEWGSRYFSIAPGVSWPVLDWAPLHAAIRAQDERQVQAALAYQTAVAQALKDVADSLVQYGSERERNASLVRTVAQARRARRVAAQVYANGLADQLASLLAERSLLQAEDALAQSDANLRTDLVGLYKALGGGWDVNPQKTK